MKKNIFYVFFILSVAIIILHFTQGEAKSDEKETLILYDSTLSMSDPSDGTYKFEMASNAAKKIFNKLNGRENTGLRVIGINIEKYPVVNLSNPIEDLCTKTYLAVPIGKNNVKQTNDVLDSLFPLGATPLTYSLKLSIDNDFSADARKHIILITDGGEGCNEDPCNYISTIMNTRNDIKIDVIAIGVDDNDYRQLRCLSDKTGGYIYNVRNEEEINNALNNIVYETLNENRKVVPQNPNEQRSTVPSSGIIYKKYTLEVEN